jgi:hypothetical protein
MRTFGEHQAWLSSGGLPSLPARRGTHRVSAALQFGLAACDPASRGPSAGIQFPWRSGCARRHCNDRGTGVTPSQSKFSWIKTVMILHPVLPMRAVLIAAAAAALGLLALANLSVSAPSSASVAQAQVRAPVAARVVGNPLTLARADDVIR